MKSITSLGARAPVNPAEVLGWRRAPPPSEEQASGREKVEGRGEEGGKGRERRLEYRRATVNSVWARRPTGTLIKYLDIFIDKLLISILLSLGKTDNFIFLSGRRMKGGGVGGTLFQEFN